MAAGDSYRNWGTGLSWGTIAAGLIPGVGTLAAIALATGGGFFSSLLGSKGAQEDIDEQVDVLEDREQTMENLLTGVDPTVNAQKQDNIDRLVNEMRVGNRKDLSNLRQETREINREISGRATEQKSKLQSARSEISGQIENLEENKGDIKNTMYFDAIASGAVEGLKTYAGHKLADAVKGVDKAEETVSGVTDSITEDLSENLNIPEVSDTIGGRTTPDLYKLDAADNFVNTLPKTPEGFSDVATETSSQLKFTDVKPEVIYDPLDLNDIGVLEKTIKDNNVGKLEYEIGKSRPKSPFVTDNIFGGNELWDF